MIRWKTWLVPAFACTCFWACAGTPGRSLPPSPVDGVALQVHSGDRIALRVFQEEAMSDTFVVSQNGEVILPRLGPVQVAGAEIAALQDSLRSALGKYLRNPAVEVTVLRRVGVHGEVNQPGLYLVDLTMTLRDVIARAGGITASGDPNKIYLVRDGRRIDIGSETEPRFSSAVLHSGDQVVVQQRPWIQRNSLAFASTAAVVVSLLVPVLRSIF